MADAEERDGIERGHRQPELLGERFPACRESGPSFSRIDGLRRLRLPRDSRFRTAEAMKPTGIPATLRAFDALAEARGTVRGDEAPIGFFANGARLRGAHGNHFE